MLTDTEGIVLRQIKTSYNRRMIVLFSRKYGKIRAGTSLGDKGRSKSSLALRPFTFGRYELFVNRDSYNINSAEVLRSYYKIGEDVDKYMNGAYVLEFTEKVLEEGVPQTGVFDLLIDFFTLLLTPLFAQAMALPLRIAILAAGCVILAYGMTIVIKSDAGTGPNDLVAIVISDKLHAKFSIVRIIVDACFIAVGWLLGGTFGIGTVICAALVGPVAGVFLPCNQRIIERILHAFLKSDG